MIAKKKTLVKKLFDLSIIGTAGKRNVHGAPPRIIKCS